jgi:hypothetical protein
MIFIIFLPLSIKKYILKNVKYLRITTKIFISFNSRSNTKLIEIIHSTIRYTCCYVLKIISSFAWLIMIKIRLYGIKQIINNWEAVELVFMLHKLVIDILLQQL